MPELVAEADAGSPHLQPADALVAVVFGDDDRDLEVLLERSHQLGRVHQVGAVADEDIDLALGLCQADAEAGRHLIAHAGVAKLQMASAAGRGIPQLEQIARRTPGSRDDRVAGAGLVIEGLDQLALAHRLAFLMREDLALELLRPGFAGAGDLLQIGRPWPDVRCLRGLMQSTKRLARVRGDRHGALLVGIVAGNVDADETYLRVIEAGLRAGSKVRQARADANHQVGLADERGSRARSFQTMTAERHGRGITQGTLAGERLGDRNAQGLGEILQFLPRLRIVNAAASDDHRPLGFLE